MFLLGFLFYFFNDCRKEIACGRLLTLAVCIAALIIKIMQVSYGATSNALRCRVILSLLFVLYFDARKKETKKISK